MRKNQFKKGLVVGIIVLFIGASVVPSTGMVEISNNGRGIFYVGGSGPGNYTSIQDAIDNASSGDTVFVYDGTYYENVVVNKTINLIGEDRNNTIIDGGGSGDVVYIEYDTDWVNISGFTIQNSGSYNAGIRSLFGCNNIKIYKNIISADIILDSDGNVITYNDCSDISLCGNDQIIKNNTFNSISFQYGGNNNVITDNDCNSISFWSTSNNIISRNNCSNGTGISHWYSSYSVIKNNIVSGNNGHGIDIEESDHNIISNNTFIGNSGDGIHLADYCDLNTINNNICNENGGSGIQSCNLCKKSYAKANQNIIENNTCNDNNGCGINVNMAGGDSYINNSCKNNNNGIHLYDSANNIFSDNTITNNDNGIYLSYDNNDNLIYHNNLINNTQNAYDENSNTWYNSTLQEGNYWDDYNGIDDDGDGIGDTPYNISGGDNQDLYPLMKPYGSPIANFTYYASNRAFDGSSSYDIDGVIVLYEWDFGDGTTGQGKIVTHVYYESGTYNITLTVTDDDGYHGSITKSVDIIGNYPPGEPIINGPLTGKAGTMYSYMFVSEDLNGDDIFYEINWGDGITDPWDGPHESNTIITIDHNWSEQGTYTIMARAKDVYDAIGDWGTLEVTMPRSKTFFYNSPLLNWLFERFPLLQRLFTILGVYVV